MSRMMQTMNKKSSTPLERNWGTTLEAAEILRVHAKTARIWALSGEFDTKGKRAWIRVGRAYRIDLDMVKDWLRRKEVAV